MTPEQLRAEVVVYARSLVGIRETPPHSNDGLAVRKLQAATGAFREPWCVSTVQAIWLHVLGTTWADRTANAYYLAAYARQHGCVIDRPLPGCAVVYRIGAGHAGTVVNVSPRLGTFVAVEGNEADSVAKVTRDPRHIGCTFILRPELTDPRRIG